MGREGIGEREGEERGRVKSWDGLRKGGGAEDTILDKFVQKLFHFFSSSAPSRKLKWGKKLCL